MSNVHFLKFGPDGVYRGMREKAYIAFGERAARKQQGSDLLIGSEHASLASFKAEVDSIRRDLEEALQEAEAYFASKGRN